MSAKDQVIEHLRAHTGEYISGEGIAQELGVSRAAIWKAIQSLQQEGYPITAVRNRGYRLGGFYDILDGQSILAAMPTDIAQQINIQVRQKTGSTNNDVRALADSGAPEFSIVVSGEQLSGKGRRGRSFYSQRDVGVYLSILLKPGSEMRKATHITCAAAVAVCRALVRICHVNPQIKWVNDVYIDDHKVCGILTEGVSDLETGRLNHAIVGIGVNVYEPEDGYPDEIAKRAGAVTKHRQTNLRNEIAATVISEFIELYQNQENASFITEYKERSFLPGKRITVLKGPKKSKSAIALAIEDDLSLRVRYDDGSEECLNSGEVSIRLTD